MGKVGRYILVIVAAALLVAALVGLPACGKAKLTATTTTVTSSLNPSTYGELVTFTATVSDTSGTTTGTVQFKIDGQTWGSPVPSPRAVPPAMLFPLFLPALIASPQSMVETPVLPPAPALS